MLETSSVLVPPASSRRVGVPWLLAPALRFAPTRSPRSVGRIAPSLGYYGDYKHWYAAGNHPQSCISIQWCYKRYRGGAMRSAWRGSIPGYRGGAIQDRGYELRRIPIPRTRVNKGKKEDWGAPCPPSWQHFYTSLPTIAHPQLHGTNRLCTP